MFVFALYQYLKDYNNNNIFVAFLYQSKSFDELNHNILFHFISSLAWKAESNEI